MANKVQPCTLAAKHKWEFVKNVTISNVSIGPRGTVARFSLRGRYKCACGAKKLGQSQREPDPVVAAAMEQEADHGE